MVRPADESPGPKKPPTPFIGPIPGDADRSDYPNSNESKGSKPKPAPPKSPLSPTFPVGPGSTVPTSPIRQSTANPSPVSSIYDPPSSKTTPLTTPSPIPKSPLQQLLDPNREEPSTNTGPPSVAEVMYRAKKRREKNLPRLREENIEERRSQLAKLAEESRRKSKSYFERYPEQAALLKSAQELAAVDPVGGKFALTEILEGYYKDVADRIDERSERNLDRLETKLFDWDNQLRDGNYDYDPEINPKLLETVFEGDRKIARMTEDWKKLQSQFPAGSEQRLAVDEYYRIALGSPSYKTGLTGRRENARDYNERLDYLVDNFNKNAANAYKYAKGDDKPEGDSPKLEVRTAEVRKKEAKEQQYLVEKAIQLGLPLNDEAFNYIRWKDFTGKLTGNELDVTDPEQYFLNAQNGVPQAAPKQPDTEEKKARLDQIIVKSIPIAGSYLSANEGVSSFVADSFIWTLDKVGRPLESIAAAGKALLEADAEIGEHNSKFDKLIRALVPINPMGQNPLYALDDIFEDPGKVLDIADAAKQGLTEGGWGKMGEHYYSFVDVVKYHAEQDGIEDYRDSGWYQWPVGILGDIALDPLNYVLPGVGTASRQATKASIAAEKAWQEGSQQITQNATRLSNSISKNFSDFQYSPDEVADLLGANLPLPRTTQERIAQTKTVQENVTKLREEMQRAGAFDEDIEAVINQGRALRDEREFRISEWRGQQELDDVQKELDELVSSGEITEAQAQEHIAALTSSGKEAAKFAEALRVVEFYDQTARWMGIFKPLAKNLQAKYDADPTIARILASLSRTNDLDRRAALLSDLEAAEARLGIRREADPAKVTELYQESLRALEAKGITTPEQVDEAVLQAGKTLDSGQYTQKFLDVDAAPLRLQSLKRARAHAAKAKGYNEGNAPKGSLEEALTTLFPKVTADPAYSPALIADAVKVARDFARNLPDEQNYYKSIQNINKRIKQAKLEKNKQRIKNLYVVRDQRQRLLDQQIAARAVFHMRQETGDITADVFKRTQSLKRLSEVAETTLRQLEESGDIAALNDPLTGLTQRNMPGQVMLNGAEGSPVVAPPKPESLLDPNDPLKWVIRPDVPDARYFSNYREQLEYLSAAAKEERKTRLARAFSAFDEADMADAPPALFDTYGQVRPEMFVGRAGANDGHIPLLEFTADGRFVPNRNANITKRQREWVERAAIRMNMQYDSLFSKLLQSAEYGKKPRIELEAELKEIVEGWQEKIIPEDLERIAKVREMFDGDSAIPAVEINGKPYKLRRVSTVRVDKRTGKQYEATAYAGKLIPVNAETRSRMNRFERITSLLAETRTKPKFMYMLDQYRRESNEIAMGTKVAGEYSFDRRNLEEFVYYLGQVDSRFAGYRNTGEFIPRHLLDRLETLTFNDALKLDEHAVGFVRQFNKQHGMTITEARALKDRAERRVVMGKPNTRFAQAFPEGITKTDFMVAFRTQDKSLFSKMFYPGSPLNPREFYDYTPESLYKFAYVEQVDHKAINTIFDASKASKKLQPNAYFDHLVGVSNKIIDDHLMKARYKFVDESIPKITGAKGETHPKHSKLINQKIIEFSAKRIAMNKKIQATAHDAVVRDTIADLSLGTYTRGVYNIDLPRSGMARETVPDPVSVINTHHEQRLAQLKARRKELLEQKAAASNSADIAAIDEQLAILLEKKNALVEGRVKKLERNEIFTKKLDDLYIENSILRYAEVQPFPERKSLYIKALGRPVLEIPGTQYLMDGVALLSEARMQRRTLDTVESSYLPDFRAPSKRFSDSTMMEIYYRVRNRPDMLISMHLKAIQKAFGMGSRVIGTAERERIFNLIKRADNKEAIVGTPEYAVIEEAFAPVVRMLTTDRGMVSGTEFVVKLEDINRWMSGPVGFDLKRAAKLPAGQPLDAYDIIKLWGKPRKSYEAPSDLKKAAQVRRRNQQRKHDPFVLSFDLAIAAEKAKAHKVLLNDLYRSVGVKRTPSASGLGKGADNKVRSGDAYEKLRKNHGWKTLEDLKPGFYLADDAHLFPPEVQPEIVRLLDMFEPRNIGEFGLRMDQALGIWKAANTIYNPGYWTRNAVGEFMVSWLAGVNSLKPYNIAKDILKFAKGVDGEVEQLHQAYPMLKSIGLADDTIDPKKVAFYRNINGQRQAVTHEDLYIMYMDSGLSTGFINTETEAALGRLAEKGEGLKTGVRGAASNTHTRLRNAGENFEDYFRMAHFVDVVQKSKKPLAEAAQEAAAAVRKYHFDYNDVSKFEQTVMLRLYPFFKWTRKALPLLIGQLFTNTGKMVAYPKLMNGISNAISGQDMAEDPNGIFPTYEGLVPNFVSNLWAYGISKDPDEFNQDTFFRLATPQTDALGALTDPKNLAYSMSNPLVKVPAEIAFGRTVSKEAGGDFNTSFGPRPWLSDEESVNGKSGSVNALKALLGMAPAGRQVAKGITDKRTDGMEDADKYNYNWQDLATFTTGLGFYEAEQK